MNEKEEKELVRVIIATVVLHGLVGRSDNVLSGGQNIKLALDYADELLKRVAE